jgi:hypothetical protein
MISSLGNFWWGQSSLTLNAGQMECGRLKTQCILCVQAQLRHCMSYVLARPIIERGTRRGAIHHHELVCLLAT